MFINYDRPRVSTVGCDYLVAPHNHHRNRRPRELTIGNIMFDLLVYTYETISDHSSKMRVGVTSKRVILVRISFFVVFLELYWKHLFDKSAYFSSELPVAITYPEEVERWVVPYIRY